MTISVVCASLGRESLSKILPPLANSPAIAELLIILPPEHPNSTYHTPCSHLPKVSYHHSHLKGQVNQRVYGCRLATSPYILFIDDDIMVETSDVSVLYETISKLPYPSVLAPRISFINKLSPLKSSFFSSDSLLLWLSKFENFFRRNGNYVPFSLTYFHHPLTVYSPIQQVDWLAGGCLLFSRSLAPLESYYPYRGKAYAEDIYLSEYFHQYNAKFYILRNISVFTSYLPTKTFNPVLFSVLSTYRLRQATTSSSLLFTLLTLLLHLFFLVSFYSLSFIISSILSFGKSSNAY